MIWASVRDAIAVLLGGNLGEIAFTVGAGLLLLAVRPPRSTSAETLLHEGPDVSLGSYLARDIVT